MKTSDHFIGVPATSLPGTSVFAIPGAGFQVLRGKSVSKSNQVSRPTLICPSRSENSAMGEAVERPEPSRLTWSGDRGAVPCEVGCTQFWKNEKSVPVSHFSRLRSPSQGVCAPFFQVLSP